MYSAHLLQKALAVAEALNAAHKATLVTLEKEGGFPMSCLALKDLTEQADAVIAGIRAASEVPYDG